MTKLQKLNKAKKESLKKWEEFIDKRVYWHKFMKRCGFCKQYLEALDCCKCPIYKTEDKCCASLSCSRNLERKLYISVEGKDITPFALAVMVYIHGFTVADLPEEK